MTSPLHQAAAILQGSVTVPVHSVRAAAWIARSALEDVLRDLVRARGCDPHWANNRSLLCCVEALYQDDAPDVAARAQYAWDALSEASHYHAYELSPTLAEVSGLIELVEELSEVAAARASSESAI